MSPLIDASLHLLARNRLSVFLFHAVPRVSPEIPRDFTIDQFEETLHFIKKRFNVVPLDVAVNAMKSGRLKPRTACLTFDDGYPTWINGIGPLLEANGLHATLYITTGQFSGLPLWHERVARAINAHNGHNLEIYGFGLPPLATGSIIEKRRAFSMIEQYLKYQTLHDREAMLQTLERHCKVDASDVPRMTVEQLKTLSNLGFAIGAHTYSHPILARCDNDQAFLEIASGRESLRGLLGIPIDSFAYPNGRPGVDFNGDHVAMVKAAGYRHAVTTDWGVAHAGTSPYEIPRFTPWGPTPDRMALQVTRNLLSLPRKTPRPSSGEATNVLVVENGAGFGGAVIALKSLLENADPVRTRFHVVTNIPIQDIQGLPALAGIKIMRDRLIDTRRIASYLTRYSPLAVRKSLLFLVGRVDDLVNRLPYLVRLAWHVYFLQPDVVHGNNEPISNREVMLVASAFRRPYVQHVRGALSGARLSPWLLSRPSLFVPVSRWLSGELLRLGVSGHRIRQIYDCVKIGDDEATSDVNLRSELGLAPDTTLVGMVGMLVPWKGQDLFIEAVSQIITDGGANSSVAFLLFGDTPEHGDASYKEKLRALTQKLELQGIIRFMGRQSGLVGILPQIDVVVSASTEPEPLGLVMIEAMASGCAFIAPAHGAATEVVEEGVNGFLFKPRDVQDLARVLKKVIRYRRDAGALSKAERYRVIEQFSPKRCAEVIMYAYEHAKNSH